MELGRNLAIEFLGYRREKLGGLGRGALDRLDDPSTSQGGYGDQAIQPDRRSVELTQVPQNASSTRAARPFSSTRIIED